MKDDAVQRIGNLLLPIAAGIASFVMSMAALLLLTDFNSKMQAAIVLGVFCLLISWIATERPNSETARVGAALVERLLAGERGDLSSPAPARVHRAMPAVGQAVDHLFSQVRASIDNARAIALFDPVTSLPNRLHFRAQAETLLAARDPQVLAAMLFVDLDRFKAINDNLGHARGDEALKMVGTRLREVVATEGGDDPSLRPIVARLAGDEFTIFLPSLADAADAVRIAGRVLSSLSQPFVIRGKSLDIGSSIGVALCPRHGHDLAALMRSSDLAMYEAKAAGGGQVCLFDEALALECEDRANIEAGLAQALSNDELELYFQPKVDAATGRLIAVEALLRWRHGIDGIRLPGTFISIAEGCGLIVDLGDWVIEAVGATLSRWRALGIDTRIAINVSPRQLDRAQFFVRLREALQRTGGELDQLELEVSESTVSDLGPAAIEDMAALRAQGVSIALDDFGTGYSNLARLKDMPLDHIKIDRMLIRDIAIDDSARVVVQAVVQLVHGLGCKAVAEGVETGAQIEVLRLIGCDTLQGYAIGEPMEEAALLEWIGAMAQPESGNMRAITAA